MREKAINAYIFIVLVLFNALSLNLNILGLKLENLLLLIVAIGVFVVSVIQEFSQKRNWKEISIADWVMGILCVAEIGWILYKLIAEGFCGDADILLLILLLSYFIIHTYQGKCYNFLFAFSIANMIIYAGLLYSAITGSGQIVVGGYLLQNQNMLSWLVLSIVAGIVAYCTDKHLNVWYAVQILFGSFLLFLQKNFICISLVGMAFLLVLFFAPLNRKLIKRVGVLILGYVCLFVNMSSIVNYTTFLMNPVPYSIKMSVYLAFVLAGIVLIAYVCWNRWDKGADAEAKISKRVKKFAKILLILACVVTIVIMVQLLSGNVVQMPEVITKLLNYVQLCLSVNAGIMPTMIDVCGVVGIFTIIYLIYLAITQIVIGNYKKKSKNVWIYMVISIVYCLQILGLTQSIRNTLLYAVFLFLGLRRNRLEK